MAWEVVTSNKPLRKGEAFLKRDGVFVAKIYKNCDIDSLKFAEYLVAQMNRKPKAKWLRWVEGRQGSGYDKMLIATGRFPLPFDLYLIRYPVGSSIPPHRDPVPGSEHYRVNVVVRKSQSGGEFECENAIYKSSRVNLFRSDLCEHSVSKVEGSPRYVLSLGWLRKAPKS